MVMLEMVLTLSIPSLPLPSSLFPFYHPPFLPSSCHDVLSGAIPIGRIKANNAISYGNLQCLAVARLCVVIDEGCDTLRTGMDSLGNQPQEKNKSSACSQVLYSTIGQHPQGVRIFRGWAGNHPSYLSIHFLLPH